MGLESLASVYARHSYHVGGGDKGTVHDYLPTYERHMTKRNGVTLCEIGVYFGHSIAMWNEYLIDSTVYGLDIDLSRLRYQLPHVYQCDATSHIQVQQVLGAARFDYIIDDGSHRLADQIAAFDVLWPRLKTGGVYFIEDIDGNGALEALSHKMKIEGIDFEIYDGRSNERQWDELMLIATRH